MGLSWQFHEATITQASALFCLFPYPKAISNLVSAPHLMQLEVQPSHSHSRPGVVRRGWYSWLRHLPLSSLLRSHSQTLNVHFTGQNLIIRPHRAPGRLRSMVFGLGDLLPGMKPGFHGLGRRQAGQWVDPAVTATLAIPSAFDYRCLLSQSAVQEGWLFL